MYLSLSIYIYIYYSICQLRPLTYLRGGLRAIYNPLCNNDLRIDILFFRMARPVGATQVFEVFREIGHYWSLGNKRWQKL